eukprot:4026850-Amphidinium_carterae.1
MPDLEATPTAAEMPPAEKPIAKGKAASKPKAKAAAPKPKAKAAAPKPKAKAATSQPKAKAATSKPKAKAATSKRPASREAYDSDFLPQSPL